MAELIDLPFGLWIRMGQRKHRFNHIRQVAPMCPHERAHWRHLANMTEPSVCCCDVALCQITLTTCLLSPYGIGQTIYIFMLWFVLSSFFFIPRLISAAADWMSAILSHMVWP